MRAPRQTAAPNAAGTEDVLIRNHDVLWGYDLGPQAMTDDGRALLVNVTHALR